VPPDGTLTRIRDPYLRDCDDSDDVGPSAALAVTADGTVWAPFPDGGLDRFAAGPAAPPPVRPRAGRDRELR
jgi:hypothetical protein